MRLILHGDCMELMAGMEADSVDAIVTDPPYGLEFMGKEWDKFDRKLIKADGRNAPIFKQAKPNSWQAGLPFQAWTTQWATEALRVLKPGGGLLSFGGTRTFHRLTCGLEDSGFIIKDCLMYLYGAGFPKAQDLGKMIDKRLGAEREVVSRTPKKAFGYEDRPWKHGEDADVDIKTAPASDLATHWDGYKIGGIKPAWEPIIWAVKPPEGAWIDNVLTYGVGAVNADECRVGTDDNIGRKSDGTENQRQADGWRTKSINKPGSPKGRFPANLLLDEEAARLLDEQSGVSSSKPHQSGLLSGDGSHEGWVRPSHKDGFRPWSPHSDTGGASRFFYTSKATDRQEYNDHPTLKPTDLIEWLIRLVTRPGQLVLDPFAGSGTTGVAAIQSGREFILIEQDSHYCDIAERRTTDGAQQGMF